MTPDANSEVRVGQVYEGPSGQRYRITDTSEFDIGQVEGVVVDTEGPAIPVGQSVMVGDIGVLIPALALLNRYTLIEDPD